MSILRPYLDKLGTSRPIFKVQLSHSKDYLEPQIDSPIYQFTPPVDQNDPYSELVYRHYRESFNYRSGRFRILEEDITSSIMNEIKSELRKLLENKLEMKNPRQSKIYRWVAYEMRSHSHQDTLLMLWKYNQQNSGSQHTDNIIAILSAMMRKFSNE